MEYSIKGNTITLYCFISKKQPPHKCFTCIHISHNTFNQPVAVILKQLESFGFPQDYAVECIRMNKHNHLTTTYKMGVIRGGRPGNVDISRVWQTGMYVDK